MGGTLLLLLLCHLGLGPLWLLFTPGEKLLLVSIVPKKLPFKANSHHGGILFGTTTTAAAAA